MMLYVPWCETGEQWCRIGCHKWRVSRLIDLSRPLKVMSIPLEHINMYYKYTDMTLRELAGHVVAINSADLRHPIILDEDGEIMDGRHRLIKAIITGKKTIKAVRFPANPVPDVYEEKK